MCVMTKLEKCKAKMKNQGNQYWVVYAVVSHILYDQTYDKKMYFIKRCDLFQENIG